tara:strand:+ start:150 stop:557 length:408 start_codon:yes stop_codon:yes gene_type:complete
MTKDKTVKLYYFDLEKIDDIKKFVGYRNENKKDNEEDFEDFKIETINGTRNGSHIDFVDGETTFEIRSRSTSVEEPRFSIDLDKFTPRYELKKVRLETYLVTSFFDISYKEFGEGVKLLSVTDTVTKTFLEEEEE